MQYLFEGMIVSGNCGDGLGIHFGVSRVLPGNFLVRQGIFGEGKGIHLGVEGGELFGLNTF